MTIIYGLIVIIVSCVILSYAIHKLVPKSDSPSIYIIIGFVGLLALLFSCASYYTRHREYDRFVRERDVFALTLNDSRKNGREMEAVAIIKDVINWNYKLVNFQHESGRPLIGEFYDVRFKDLKPIK